MKLKIILFSILPLLFFISVNSSEVDCNQFKKFSAKYVFNKLQSKGIILRSTEDGYNIKNKLRLTIGSTKENTKFTKAIKSIFN